MLFEVRKKYESKKPQVTKTKKQFFYPNVQLVLRGSFTKNDQIQKLKKKNSIFKKYLSNELDKACFEHYKAYGDFKALLWRAASEKVLCDKAFSIGKCPKYDWYQCELLQWVTIFLLKKSASHTGAEILIQILKINN